MSASTYVKSSVLHKNVVRLTKEPRLDLFVTESKSRSRTPNPVDFPGQQPIKALEPAHRDRTPSCRSSAFLAG